MSVSHAYNRFLRRVPDYAPWIVVSLLVCACVGVLIALGSSGGDIARQAEQLQKDSHAVNAGIASASESNDVLIDTTSRSAQHVHDLSESVSGSQLGMLNLREAFGISTDSVHALAIQSDNAHELAAGLLATSTTLDGDAQAFVDSLRGTTQTLDSIVEATQGLSPAAAAVRKHSATTQEQVASLSSGIEAFTKDLDRTTASANSLAHAANSVDSYTQSITKSAQQVSSMADSISKGAEGMVARSTTVHDGLQRTEILLDNTLTTVEQALAQLDEALAELAAADASTSGEIARARATANIDAARSYLAGSLEGSENASASVVLVNTAQREVAGMLAVVADGSGNNSNDSLIGDANFVLSTAQGLAQASSGYSKTIKEFESATGSLTPLVGTLVAHAGNVNAQSGALSKNAQHVTSSLNDLKDSATTLQQSARGIKDVQQEASLWNKELASNGSLVALGAQSVALSSSKLADTLSSTVAQGTEATTSLSGVSLAIADVDSSLASLAQGVEVSSELISAAAQAGTQFEAHQMEIGQRAVALMEGSAQFAQAVDREKSAPVWMIGIVGLVVLALSLATIGLVRSFRSVELRE